MFTRRLFSPALIAITLLATAVSPAAASQQERVDYVIARIHTTLEDSLKTQQWQPKYRLATMNIEDLGKTLEQGGAITSNPVAAFGERLDGMLNERRETLAFLVAMRQKVQKMRRKEAKGTVNDIGVEMINRLVIRPGKLAPIGAMNTRNAKVIRDDFARLKSFDDALRKINEYEISIRPAINDVVQRVNALNPLLIAYGKLGAKGFDGTYIGQFEGGGRGRLKFTVKGNSVTGSISGSCTESPCGVDPMVGRFQGTVSEDGTITTRLTGTLTDASGTFKKPFPFSGYVNGKITGSGARGEWDGKNSFGNPKGGWSANR